MREIVFRGKRTDNGEWVYGSFIPDLLEVYQNESGKWLGDWGFIKPFEKTKEERLMVEVKRGTVGQYTGIKDKNGKKIFEGDIVKNKENEISKIYFSEIFLQFVRDCEECYRYSEPIDFTGFEELEVIGNIYDNPELLEGEENGH